MKKYFFVISSFLFALLIVPSVALGIANPPDIAVINTTPEVESVLIRIINFILAFGAALAVLFIIIGGVMYMTSAGSEDRIKKAKSVLWASVLGLIIIIVSVVIVNLTSKITNQVVKCGANQEAYQIVGSNGQPTGAYGCKNK